MREIIYRNDYNNGMCSYLVEKDVGVERVSVIVSDTSNGQTKEVERIEYENIKNDFKSPFLNWYNLIFCSNYYGPSPDYEYMNRAVQEGKKTAATLYLEPNSEEGKEIVQKLPPDCDFLPYGEFMIYVFHKGCLADFFNFEEIRSIYEAHNVQNIDWNRVQEYFLKPMSFFGDESVCGFSLQNGVTREQNVIIGLILGYPVESTVCLLKSNQKAETIF